MVIALLGGALLTDACLCVLAVLAVIMPIYHTLHTESTLRIYWFLHHTFFHHTNKSIRRLPIIINLLTFVVLSSLRCLVPVQFSIIVTTYLVTIALALRYSMCYSVSIATDIVTMMLKRTGTKQQINDRTTNLS